MRKILGSVVRGLESTRRMREKNLVRKKKKEMTAEASPFCASDHIHT